MRTTIKRMGNSAGVILPKPLLAQLGLAVGGAVDLSVRDGSLVATPAPGAKRANWAEAAAKMAASGDDRAVWPDFPNDDDPSLTW